MSHSAAWTSLKLLAVLLPRTSNAVITDLIKIEIKHSELNIQ